MGVRSALGVLATATLIAGAAPARAVILGFGCITGNLAAHCAVGEAQLSVELSDLGGGFVRFHFRNAGPAASAISEVYFDDGSLLALATVIDGPGVDFEPGANPMNLPGGNTVVPPFQVTAGFLAESVPAPPKNGVGPGEWLKIDFSLQESRTFADVLGDLASGDLRIGIHVIAFASEGSESFVNVPEPAVPLLGLCCLLASLALTRAGPSEARSRRRLPPVRGASESPGAP